MTKEIHFYTNLLDERVCPEEELTDMLSDYVGTLNAINIGINTIRTTQLCFLDNPTDLFRRGYTIVLHNDGRSTQISESFKDMNVYSLLVGGTIEDIK